jgi:hypothetical protein
LQWHLYLRNLPLRWHDAPSSTWRGRCLGAVWRRDHLGVIALGAVGSDADRMRIDPRGTQRVELSKNGDKTEGPWLTATLATAFAPNRPSSSWGRQGVPCSRPQTRRGMPAIKIANADNVSVLALRRCYLICNPSKNSTVSYSKASHGMANAQVT